MSEGERSYALRFISGKYQGGEFPLKTNSEIIIGRSSDLDMVLVEDMVSRKHTKIETNSGEVMIEDLGSTNGTFVNGEKIKKTRLREGDRVLIGTSIIKLVTIDGPPAEPPKGPLPTTAPSDGETVMPSSGKKPSGGARSMSGTIDEIPLPDLLQLLSTSKKSGALQLDSEGMEGRIYLRDGQIYYAAITGAVELNPEKAIYRILCWTTGTFELLAPDDKEFLNELEESTEHLLMEAMRHMDEIGMVKDSLPARTAKLSLAKPPPVPLRELAPEELDVVELVLTHGGTLQEAIDKYSGPDLDAYKGISELIKKRVITAD